MKKSNFSPLFCFSLSISSQNIVQHIIENLLGQDDGNPLISYFLFASHFAMSVQKFGISSTNAKIIMASRAVTWAALKVLLALQNFTGQNILSVTSEGCNCPLHGCEDPNTSQRSAGHFCCLVPLLFPIQQFPMPYPVVSHSLPGQLS